MTHYLAMFLFVTVGAASAVVLASGGSAIAGISLIACIAGIVALQSGWSR